MPVPFSRALVTGAAGFIGSHITDFLVSNGCNVIALDDFSSGNMENLKMSAKSNRIMIVKGDVNDSELVTKLLQDVEVVFHEAAIVSVKRSLEQPEITKHVNIDGTKNMLECASKSNVTRFIFASTGAIYGNSPILPRVESDVATPISTYGITKLECEKECLKTYEKNGLAVTILRYFNTYGIRSKSKPYSGAINIFAERLIANKSPVIFGDGKQSRDFVNVQDIVGANALAASSSNGSGQIFNVGTGIATTIERLARLECAFFHGKEDAISIEYQKAREGDVLHSYADISKIKKRLGFEPKVKFENGLKEYLKSAYPT